MTPAIATHESAAARQARITRGAIIGKALSHEVRIEVLLLLDANSRATSPNEMREAGVARPSSNPHLNYHVGLLRKLGCVRSVRTRRARGGTEHFYVLTTFGRAIVGYVGEGR